MKKISLILALVMLLTVMLAFTSCTADSSDKDGSGKDKVEDNNDNNDKNDNKGENKPLDVDINGLFEAVNEAAPFDEYVSEILFKKDDPDEMVCWTYGVIDIKGYELLSDYVITFPSDYCNTLAILKFEDGMTKADIAEVKSVITTEYIRSRASALQMYMPEQYACMKWALENPDAIWRQYGDNLLILAITGDSEPTAVWNAVDAYINK